MPNYVFRLKNILISYQISNDSDSHGNFLNTRSSFIFCNLYHVNLKSRTCRMYFLKKLLLGDSRGKKGTGVNRDANGHSTVDLIQSANPLPNFIENIRLLQLFAEKQ